MSDVIDQRVVEMEFDNARFEQNMRTTTNSLEKFKKTLNFEGATKGFENIDLASKKVDFTSIGTALETVKSKFTALEVAAVTVLVNITNMAFDAGKRIVKALTIAPIADGFQEYEMVLNAVQTTMAGTGKTMKEVEAELGRLDDYADKTVYSTRDMLQSLPKFTNAGVMLEPATTAMIGIANAVALAGGGAAQASSAFYNLGQSIGTGYLTRMDYNSFNLAGAATVEWKNHMVDAAIAAGTLTKAEDGLFKIGKKTFTLQSLFIDGLQEQWATTDVMLKVFGDYGDQTTDVGKRAWAAAQDLKTFSQMMESLKASAGTGWKETWQLIFGDLEEAKLLWTGLGTFINGIIGGATKARNTMLKEWKNLGGRFLMIEAIKNSFNGVLTVLKSIKEAFLEIFPPRALQDLMKFTRFFYEASLKFKLGEEAAENLKRTFKGLFAFLSIIGSAFKALGQFISPLWDIFLKLGAAILKVTASIGDLLVKIDGLIKSGDLFGLAADKIISFAKNSAKAIKDFISSMKEKFQTPGFDKFHELLSKIHLKLSEVYEKITDVKFGVIYAVSEMAKSIKNSKFYDFFSKVWDVVKNIGEAIGRLFGSIIRGLGQLLGSANYQNIFTVINGVIKGGIGLAIINFIQKITEAVKTGSGILDKIKTVFGVLTDTLQTLQNKLKSEILVKIAIAVTLLAGSLLIISLIDSDKLKTAMITITSLFIELMTALMIFNRNIGPKGASKSVGVLITISAAVLILATALKTIGSLNPEQITAGLLAVTTLLAEMLIITKIMQKSGNTVIKGSMQMVFFAVALKILASALLDLSGLNWDQVGIGLAAIGGLLLSLALFSNFVEGGKGVLSASIAMIALGVAMKILASALIDFGTMDWEVLKQGLKGLAWALGIVTIALNMIPKGTVGMGIGLVLVATSMLIMAKALEKIGSINYNELNNALKTLGWALGIVTVALNLLPNNTFEIGAGLVVVSVALLILSKAIEKIGAIPYNNLNNAIKVLAWSLGLLTAALILMNGTVSGSFALLIAVGALSALVPVLSLLGAMSWDSIIKSLVALAGALVIIGLAGLLLKPVIGSIIGLGIGVVLLGLGLTGLGVGLIAIGTGLSLVAIGITALAGSLAVGATAIVAAVGAVIIGLISMVPQIIDQISLAFGAVLKMIIDQAPLIADAIIAVILESVKGFGEITPVLVETLLSVVDQALKSLVEHTPSIVDSIFQFLIGILNGIAKNLPDLIKAGVGILMSLLTGCIDALGGLDPQTLVKGIGAIAILSALMLALAALALLVPLAMLGVLGFGVVITELAFVLAGVGALSKIPGLSWMIEEGGTLLETIGVAIGKFIGGLAGGFASGAVSQFPAIGTSLSQFMVNAQPFLDGAKQIDAKLVDGVKSLAGAIAALTAANIFESVASWLTGSSSMVKFGEELAKFGPYFKKFYDSIKGVDASVVANSTNAANALAAFASNIPNSGGVVGWVTGENSLSSFADELIKFGPKLKAYADSVKGLDPNVVNNSANAAQALAAMAASLPNSGGISSWFTGENSLSSFADELTKFGPLIKDYALSVTGLDSNVIANSANAAKAMSELANNLPNSGGVVSWFAGDNDIAAFGEGLVTFGQKIVEYADTVKDLDSNVITSSTKAASALIELQNGITASSGLFSTDSNLKDFGKGLASFGKKMAEYYISIKDVDTAVLAGAIKEAYKLVGLVKYMSGIDVTGPTSFTTAMSTLAKTAIDGFVNSFTNSGTQVATALSTFFTGLETGLSQKKTFLLQAFSNLNVEIMSSFTNSYIHFITIGQKIAMMITSGAKLKESEFKLAWTNLVSAALTEMRKKYTDFYYLGRDFVQGFVNGISAYNYLAIHAARKLVADALRAIKEYQDSNSPAKETIKLGNYFGMGWVQALYSYVSDSYSAGKQIASSAIKGTSSVIGQLAQAIEDSIDADPVIRPVLDLSNIMMGSNRLNSMLDIGRTIDVAGSIGQPKTVGAPGSTSPQTPATIEFNQTINAPKDPNPIEIYRLTKNLISVTRDVVKI